MDHRAIIAEAIVVLRRRAGWNAKQFAALAGMGPAHLSRIELAKRWVTIPVLLRITNALGLSLGEFHTFAEQQAMSRDAGDAIGDRYPASDPARGALLIAQPGLSIEYPPKPEEDDEK